MRQVPRIGAAGSLMNMGGDAANRLAKAALLAVEGATGVARIFKFINSAKESPMQSSNSSKSTGSTSHNWKWLAIAALLAGSVSIVAAGPRDRGNGRHAGGLVYAFDRVDVDSDGVVTRAEFDAHVAARQAGLDGNNDGAVTFEEARALREAQREVRARERFARLDRDGNGIVTTDEVSANQLRLFTFLDRNEDGAVDREELPGRRMGR